MRAITGERVVRSLLKDAGMRLRVMHSCVRETHSKCGLCARGYEAGVAAGALAGAAGVAAGVLAGLDGVLDDELDESDVLGVALEVDAGVVLLEVDVLSVL